MYGVHFPYLRLGFDDKCLIYVGFPKPQSESPPGFLYWDRGYKPKPSFATIAGKGANPMYIHSIQNTTVMGVIFHADKYLQ